MSNENKHEENQVEQERVDETCADELKTQEEGDPSPAPETETVQEAQGAQEPPQPEKNPGELLEEQVSQLNDRLLRTMAEYDNFRKRSQREKEAIYPQATAAAVAQFAPIIDTFERALSAPCSDVEFKKGVEMILQNFKDVLFRLGVEEFGAAGEPFDPGMHNAVVHIEDESLEANTIVEVFQKGYRLGDRIVRHAMVKVAN